PRFAGEDAVDLSVSHDDSYCLCAVGAAPQGCDLAPVTARSDEEWRALLGDHRAAIRAALEARGDARDRAGTRTWAAVEAARKAIGGDEIALSVAESDGDAVVLLASSAGRSC